MNSYYKEIVMNEIVWLPSEIMKCFVCNRELLEDNFYSHINDQSHLGKMRKVKNINYDLGDLDYEKIFWSHMMILLPDLLKKYTMFPSAKSLRYPVLCFLCQVIIKDGRNGIQQHMQASNKHCSDAIHHQDTECINCSLSVCGMHFKSGFHSTIIKNYVFFETDYESLVTKYLVHIVIQKKSEHLFFFQHAWIINMKYLIYI